MRAKYSPTISERYVDRHWWFRNGGGFGLLADGSTMTDEYQHYDHEGFDCFGYGTDGRDRRGYSIRDYESSDDLYSSVAAETGQMMTRGKSVAEYWDAVSRVVGCVLDRFPDLPVTLPQQKARVPGASIYLTPEGSYGIALRFSDVDGMPRTMDIRFDDGTGGSSRADRDWSVNVVVDACGQTTRNALCHVDSADAAVRFAMEEIADYDPDRFIHDVLLVEGGDGVAYLRASARGGRVIGDILGTVHAIDASAAIAKLAERYQAGGPISRMAERGLSRLRREQESEPEFAAEHHRPSRGFHNMRSMSR